MREPERCCPAGACAYRVEAVEHYLGVLAAFRAAGEDPCQKMRAQVLDQDARGGKVGDRETALWDVQQATQALREAGRPITAIAVADWLCPWAVEG